MEMTPRQARTLNRRPVMIGQKMSPTLPPMPNIASEVPLLSEKRRDISAMDGRCQTDVAMDTSTMPKISKGYTEATPTSSQLKPNSAIQAAIMIPR